MRTLEQEQYHYSFNKNVKPAVSIDPGETVVVRTSDSVNKRIRTGTDPKELDLLAHLDSSIVNPLSGPICVNGAKRGDTITIDVVDIKVEPGWDQGWTGQLGVYGTMMSGSAPNLLEPIPDIIKICRIDSKGIHFPLKKREILIPPAPSLGTIGTCPSIEASSYSQGPFGGNMDSPDLVPGSKLYLPVFEEGGLVFVGDAHYLQGDGELTGPAVEVPSITTLTIGLIKGKKIDWPRIENSEYIMTVGNTRPLEDCVKTATVEMVRMLESEYGFDRWDAAILLSAVCRLVVNQCQSVLYSVSCKFPKKYL